MTAAEAIAILPLEVADRLAEQVRIATPTGEQLDVVARLFASVVLPRPTGA